MTKKMQSKGICLYCEQEMSKGGMSKHLSACTKRWKVIEEAEGEKGAKAMLYHLRAQDGYSGLFWLDLEIGGPNTLEDLDYYLRGIWLECCVHMSQFSIGGWRGDEIPMNRKIGMTFREGLELTHIYDFGSSSKTVIKYVGRREGRPTTTHPIALMARNIIPESKCIECERAAKWLCQECQMKGSWGSLCDEHAKDHPCDEYGSPMPQVNSP